MTRRARLPVSHTYTELQIVESSPHPLCIIEIRIGINDIGRGLPLRDLNLVGNTPPVSPVVGGINGDVGCFHDLDTSFLTQQDDEHVAPSLPRVHVDNEAARSFLLVIKQLQALHHDAASVQLQDEVQFWSPLLVMTNLQPSTNESINDEDVVGCWVAKQFEQGVFRGQVQSVDTNGVPWYKIVYTDDDAEDIEVVELCGTSITVTV